MEDNDEGLSGDGDGSSDRHGCVSIFMVLLIGDWWIVAGRMRWMRKSAGRQNIFSASSIIFSLGVDTPTSYESFSRHV
jgi:hypothetical protein